MPDDGAVLNGVHTGRFEPDDSDVVLLRLAVDKCCKRLRLTSPSSYYDYITISITNPNAVSHRLCVRGPVRIYGTGDVCVVSGGLRRVSRR